MKQYSYEGPVMYFDTCVDGRWKASTYAISEDKARNNLTCQYKKCNNYARNAKIILPGRVVMVS